MIIIFAAVIVTIAMVKIYPVHIWVDFELVTNTVMSVVTVVIIDIH